LKPDADVSNVGISSLLSSLTQLTYSSTAAADGAHQPSKPGKARKKNMRISSLNQRTNHHHGLQIAATHPAHRDPTKIFKKVTRSTPDVAAHVNLTTSSDVISEQTKDVSHGDVAKVGEKLTALVVNRTAAVEKINGYYKAPRFSLNSP
jgi:hypothetical protein